ncbi:MAG: biotin/lipoyl-binding protein [Chloroflexi bacterium]|nr:biotin/lipoyl-binding protein [Chloroflexota bacterium]
MSDDPILQAVDRLAPALEAAGLDELELTVGDLSVRLARPRALQVASVAAASVIAAAETPAVKGPTSDGLTPFGEPAPGMRFVGAPLTGVWYPAPSPGARPYVNEGDEVANGQVIGLIEAMKLFNEIKSDVSGRIVQVLVESGTLVKRKQPLLEVDPR